MTESASASRPIAPPTASEIQRKLGSPTSIPTTLSTSVQSNESQELQRRLSTASRRPHGSFSSVGATSMMSSGMSSADEDEPTSPSGRGNNLPLSAISEASGGSGSDSDASSVAGASPSAGAGAAARMVERLRISRESTRLSESVAVKSGYLMKKGERRKAWKKRWFVLRGGQVAMYKSDKEYRLLRLIPLTEIHTCSPVELKKHSYTFGIVTPKRTYYVKASSDQEVQSWCSMVEKAKQEVVAAAATTNSGSTSLREHDSLDTTPQPTAPATPAVQSPTPADTPVQSPQRSAAIPIPSSTSTASVLGYPSTSSPPSTTAAYSQTSTSALSSSYTSTSSSTGGGAAAPPNSFAVGGLGALGLQNSDGQELQLRGVDAGLTNAPQRQQSQTRTPSFSTTASEGGLAIPGGGQGYFGRPKSSASGAMSPGGGGISSSEDEDGFDTYDPSSASWAAGATPQPATPGAGGTLTFIENKPPPSQHAQQQQTTQSGPKQIDGGFGDPNKVILSGYLMKQGKRKNWRKRWFVLMSGRLMYSRSHMDTKIHRQIPLARILDAIEYDAGASTSSASRRPLSTSGPLSPSLNSDIMPTTSNASAPGSDPDKNYEHCFKIITPKRTYLVCAPSEEDEIKWLAALQCLVARKNQPQTPAAVSASPSAPPALAPPIASPSLPPPSAARRNSSHTEGESRFGHHTRQRSVTDAARAAVRDVERRFHPHAGAAQTIAAAQV